MADIKKDDSVAEEASALGQRAKGAVKNAVGSMTGNDAMERSGERDMGEGKIRQEYNNVLDETDGVRGGTASGRGALVTGMYNNPEHAQRAYNDLTSRHGYKADEISVMMSDDSRKKYFGDAKPGTELGSKAAEGAGKGGGIGAGVGAALGALFAIGTSILIPGLGLVVAGPIAGALAGAGAGGVTGGLIGAMVGAGIPEDRAAEYERGVKSGGIVIGTRARDEKHAADLQRDYANWGGTDVRM